MRTAASRRIARTAAWFESHPIRTYKHLKAGKYTFEVRAVAAGGPDPSPARTKFKIG